MREYVGRIAALWRYPVKSMGGESLRSVDIGHKGIAGDRLLAFVSSGAAKGKPLLTGEERHAMLRCQARFLPGAHLYPPSPADVEVTTPTYGTFLGDDPALIDALQQGLRTRNDLWIESDVLPRMECRPLALLSLHTLLQLSDETAMTLVSRRFRANILLELKSTSGFAEDTFAGRTLWLGSTVELQVTECIPRCRVITLDPTTGEREPSLMTHLARHHENRVGIYAAPIAAGSVCVGDPVFLA